MVQKDSAMTGRVHLFSNGSQAGDWIFHNCEDCPLWPNNAEFPDCDLYDAIMYGWLSDGTVSKEEARALGYDDPLAYTWPCKKRMGLEDET